MNKVLLIIIIFIVIGVAFYCHNMYQQLLFEKQKRKEAEQANVRLIMDSIRKQKGFTEIVKIELENLSKQFEHLHPDVVTKIANAIKLIEINQTENAIEDLAVIMENLLQEYYEKDKLFLSWIKKMKKRIDLHNLLTYCKEDNKINEVELQFFLGVKTIRNKEAHQLNQKLEHYLNATGLILGIGAIVKIASFWKPKRESELLLERLK